MWRKWYTSRNASAVTFQLHASTVLRRATVRSVAPCRPASWAGMGASHSARVGASGDWFTNTQPSQMSQRNVGRQRCDVSRSTKSRRSGTWSSEPSVMS